LLNSDLDLISNSIRMFLTSQASPHELYSHKLKQYKGATYELHTKTYVIELTLKKKSQTH